MSGSKWQWYNEWKRDSTLQRMSDCLLSVTKTDAYRYEKKRMHKKGLLK